MKSRLRALVLGVALPAGCGALATAGVRDLTRRVRTTDGPSA